MFTRKGSRFINLYRMGYEPFTYSLKDDRRDQAGKPKIVKALPLQSLRARTLPKTTRTNTAFLDALSKERLQSKTLNRLVDVRTIGMPAKTADDPAY